MLNLISAIDANGAKLRTTTAADSELNRKSLSANERVGPIQNNIKPKTEHESKVKIRRHDGSIKEAAKAW